MDSVHDARARRGSDRLRDSAHTVRDGADRCAHRRAQSRRRSRVLHGRELLAGHLRRGARAEHGDTGVHHGDGDTVALHLPADRRRGTDRYRHSRHTICR